MSTPSTFPVIILLEILLRIVELPILIPFPVEPSIALVFTQVVIQQSTSPSIITPPEDLNMLYLVESLREGTSKSLGSIFYWDPEGGAIIDGLVDCWITT